MVTSSINAVFSRLHLKISFKTLFGVTLLLLFLWGLSAIDADGQETGIHAQILPHATSYFKALLQMDHAPSVTVAGPQPQSKLIKVAAKYDVTRIGERGIGGGLNIYSLEREQALGREMAKEIENQSRILNDPVITEYVNRIGQLLVRHSDARVPFTIKVLDNDEVNAFALPGGYFYVNSGLILAADNEAELAGVMAHEIAHVAARHATRNATKAQIWNIISLPMVFVGGPAGMIVRQVAGIAVPMTFLKFSRDAEREADLLGLEYEYSAGYDPAALVDFFERLETKRKKPNFMAKAFSTHPMNQDRIRRAQKEIETMLPPHDEYVVTTSEFDEIKVRLMELISKKPALPELGGDRPVLRRSDIGSKRDDDRPKLERR
jgi:predicted Zn-dependent protease